MQIQCENCQQAINVPATAATRRLKCPCCNTRLVIPNEGGASNSAIANHGEEDSSTAPPDEEMKRVRKTAKRQSRNKSAAKKQTASSGAATTEQPAAKTAPLKAPANVNVAPDANEEGPVEAGATATWRLKTPDGEIYGPATSRELDEWVEEGRVDAECQLALGEQPWTSALQRYPELGVDIGDESTLAGGETYAPRESEVYSRADDALTSGSAPPSLAAETSASGGATTLEADEKLTPILSAFAKWGKAAAIAVLVAAALLTLRPAKQFWSPPAESLEEGNQIVLRSAAQIALAVIVGTPSIGIWLTANAAGAFVASPSSQTLRQWSRSLVALTRWGLVAVAAAIVLQLLSLRDIF